MDREKSISNKGIGENMIEIIAMTIEDARKIEKLGANRIEFVSALTEGGLTPSLSMIEAISQAVKLPVNIMIRHHAKSFVYTDEEIGIMVDDIKKIQKISVERVKKGYTRLGVVFGVLDEFNNINIPHLEKLLKACEGLEVTFHKAIDETDVVSSIQILSRYPQITNVLTAGGKTPIEENIEVINNMLEKRGHINILLGGGLTLENVQRIKALTGATDFHFGTAVRENYSPFGKIDINNLEKLISLVG